jgi:serine acetyltransferase
MNPQRLASLREALLKLWVLSPERLWLASIALQKRGHWVLAFAIKQLNTVLYHNSLSPAASVSPDIRLGHYSFGIVINSHVVIGRRVKIWHNVTLTVRSPPNRPAQIVLEDDVKIGANAVLIAPRGQTLRIGRGAQIGAGTVVTRDVPAGARVVSQSPRVLLRDTGTVQTQTQAAGADSEADEALMQETGAED